MHWWLACALVLCLARPLCAQTLTLQWDQAPRADTYRLHYGQESGVYDTVIETGPLTSASVGGLRVGEMYFFAATGVNEHGEGPYSNEVRAVVGEPPPPVDDAFPTATLTYPADGATFDRRTTITLRAEASDDVGVARVDFYVDGTWIGNDRTPPYTASWRTPNQRNRTFSLWADAIDTAGQLTSSEVMTVRTR